jgi:SAM-dependent methyltransferase
MNRAVERLLERPVVYQTWQAWHAGQKFAPILAHNDLSRVRKVLDIGCGPGTNARFFAHSDYLGIDINPRYIETARRRYGDKFETADATTFCPPEGRTFDFILLNSLLHHIDVDGVRRILTRAAGLLGREGTVHILDLVLPLRPGLARTIARWDRGMFPRPIEQWREFFSESFEPLLFEPYPLKLLGIGWLEMVYFMGRAKR